MGHIPHINESCPIWLRYGVATISRLLKITGLFCRILSLVQGSFAKETYNFKEPTNRSHPVPEWRELSLLLFEIATCMNESCPKYERVMSDMKKAPEWRELPQLIFELVTHVNESCPTFEWVMSQIWTSHVRHEKGTWMTWVAAAYLWIFQLKPRCPPPSQINCR